MLKQNYSGHSNGIIVGDEFPYFMVRFESGLEGYFRPEDIYKENGGNSAEITAAEC